MLIFGIGFEIRIFFENINYKNIKFKRFRLKLK